MIDFVPLELYSAIYFNVLVGVVALTFLHGITLEVNDLKSRTFGLLSGTFLLFFSIFYIGLRPISGRYFADMRSYSIFYEQYAHGGEITIQNDIFFHKFMQICSGMFPVHIFFLICTFLYVVPMYIFSKSTFNSKWFYAFLMFLTSFSFWAYGTNGIRNGIATSLFLLALTFREKKLIMALIFVVTISVHKSMMLPVLAFLLTYFFKDPRKLFYGWLVTIPVSLVLGGVFVTIFTILGFADDRFSEYLSGGSGGGFRFDFLLYSASAIGVGYYFIFKRNFMDKFYHQLFCTYLIVNGFWVLVIRAEFSNRFAYLSWFMMAILIIYPFLKDQTFNLNGRVLNKILLLYFGFTYFMYFFYG
nr:EpsG family protein [Allomuricauda sp.]